MSDDKVETSAKPASILDDLTGNSTEDGAKTENGEVVTETETTETKAAPASLIDDLVGDSTEDGAKTENGEVVHETTTKD